MMTIHECQVISCYITSPLIIGISREVYPQCVGMGQDPILLVNTEIAGKWMSISEKMVVIWTVVICS